MLQEIKQSLKNWRTFFFLFSTCLHIHGWCYNWSLKFENFLEIWINPKINGGKLRLSVLVFNLRCIEDIDLLFIRKSELFQKGGVIIRWNSSLGCLSPPSHQSCSYDWVLQDSDLKVCTWTSFFTIITYFFNMWIHFSNIQTYELDWVHSIKMLLPYSCCCITHGDVFKSLRIHLNLWTSACCGYKMCGWGALFDWIHLLWIRKEKKWETK